ncbi:interferon-induced very large GTPase 1-like [Saccostrea cucullata]|uniref:interferon-induced very large GTPase 1-like n=1 Tax=Saccostrea cuccullata TaxID=36930 RepID=UPI002ED0AE02
MSSMLRSAIEYNSNKEEEIEVRRNLKRLLSKSDVDFKNRESIEKWINEDMPTEEDKYPDIFVKDLKQFFSLIEEEEFLITAAKRSDLRFIEKSYSSPIPKWQEVEEAKMEEDLSVHPMDTFYTVWLCCDPFLKSLNVISTNDSLGRLKNDRKIKEELCKTINKLLNNDEEKVQLENAIKLLCKEGFLRCNDWNSKPPRIQRFFSYLKTVLRDFKSKDAMLPLQGKDLLTRWSAIHWKLKQTSPSESYAIETKMEDTLSEIRIQQAEKCISNMELVADFIAIILSQRGCAQAVQFFLSDIENLLEEKSRKILPQMTHELVETYRRESGRDQVKTIQENLESANFGLVHLFRELGQIFESFSYCKDMCDYHIERTTWFAVQLLPRIVAHILILGRSFEIMNGEAIDISLKWVKAIFTEMAKIKGNKRVYSISVLGIQSSGKSTLLNAMFGLDFPASSGRCTRGINLHLLPVTNPHLNFEYAFIFDTEGLRSSSKHTGRTSHDNKLATLAIGIADTVILNIKGENVTCMEDTLQIVIHALMRLKQANNDIELRQSCIFVHQNVYLLGNGAKLESEIEETLNKLNAITSNIAEHEHMEYISSFNDVISFDSRHDVIYLPNLWHGTPPMAPVSKSYSNEVQRIGKHVIEQCSRKFESFYNISNTFCRIESIWKGILNEDFVFSFQNIMHMKAYNLLQEETSRQSYALEKFSNEFWRKTVKTALYCAPRQDIEITESRLFSQFCTDLDELTTSKTTFLEQYIHSSDLKSEMIQWKETKIRAIGETSNILKTVFKRKLSRQVFHYKVEWKYNDKDMEKKLLEKVAKHAKSIQDRNFSEDEKETFFSEMWELLLNEHVCDVPLETYKANKKQLRDGILIVLYGAFNKHKHLLKEALKIEPIDCCQEQNDMNLALSEEDILDEHINLKSKLKMIRILNHKTLRKCKLMTLKVTREIFKEIDTYFNQAEEDWEYDEKDFKNDILSKLLEKITTQNKDKTFSLTPEYQIKFAIKAAQISFREFSILNRRYEDKHSPRAFTISKMSQAKQVFENILLREEETVIVSNYICNELKLQIRKNVEHSVAELFKGRLLEHFSFLKRKLINAILEDLALAEKFNTFVSYIKDPEGFAKQWMKEKAVNMLSQEGDDSCETYIRRLNIDALSKEISFIMEVATHVNKDVPNNTIRCWIQTFKDNLFGYKLDTGCTALLSNDSLDDVKSFYTKLAKKIMDVELELQNEFTNQSDGSLTTGGKDPFLTVFNTLWVAMSTVLFVLSLVRTQQKITLKLIKFPIPVFNIDHLE